MYFLSLILTFLLIYFQVSLQRLIAKLKITITMAKFHNYYILCPLIDQNSFLGITRDKDAEHVIISLGRNVVNKHRLSDQKQVSGWTSKDHITAPVIYDKQQNKYVGVFNNNTVKMWTDEDTNLDKLKKYKFPINILKCITRDGQPPLLIFTNGNCASLPYAIENRKTYESKILLKDTDEIVDMACHRIKQTDHICYILKTSEGYEILYSAIRDELGDVDRTKLSRVKIVRDGDVNVVGQLISVSNKDISIYILWSDSKMATYDVQTKKWQSVGSVPWINTSSSVSMAYMGKRHLIIFGSSSDQDGAIIVAYNHVLGVASCRYPMKMYRENAKLYCYNNSIILEASNHLGMLPYTLEINRNLSSLLGTHQTITYKNCRVHYATDPPEVADWGLSRLPAVTLPSLTINETAKLGITERTACGPVLLEMTSKHNMYVQKYLITAIEEFKDIPEPIIARMVKCALNTTFSEDEFGIEYSLIDLNNIDRQLLKEIFKLEFCDALLIPYLRVTLSQNEVLILLSYIESLLFESIEPLEESYESRLYDWCIVILDAFYQQFVISAHEDITSKLTKLLKKVKGLAEQLSSASATIAELDRLLTASDKPDPQQDYLPYAIEMMKL